MGDRDRADDAALASRPDGEQRCRSIQTSSRHQASLSTLSWCLTDRHRRARWQRQSAPSPPPPVRCW